MTELSESRRRSASTRLLAVADEHLYRRNPFRITALAADASARTVREQRQRALSAYATPPVQHRMPLRKPPSNDQLRAAFDELGTPEHRLIAEIFWVWGEPGACGCPPDLHDRHDIAVLTHATALERPSGTAPDVASWRAAAVSWSALVGEKQFWAHLRHRIDVLGDRRLDDATVTGVRRSLPRALVTTLAALVGSAAEPAPLAACFDAWRVDRETVDEVRLAAATTLLDNLAALLGEVNRLLGGDKPADAAQRALDAVVPAADRLDTVLPHQRFRRSSTIRDRVAVVLNNCGVALCDSAGRYGAGATIGEVYTCAGRFAVTAETKKTVGANRRAAEMRISLDSARRRPGDPRPPHPPAGSNPPVRPSGVPARSAGARFGRTVLALTYAAALIYLLAGVAHAPIGLSVIALVVAVPAALRSVYRSSNRRAVAYLVLLGLFALPTVLVAATGAVAPSGLVVFGCVAVTVLIIATYFLRPENRR